MKPRQAAKFHIIFSIVLIVICLTVLVLKPSWLLAVSCAALVAYVAGSGIRRSRRQKLSRDSIIEYCIVAVIALVIIFGAVLR